MKVIKKPVIVDAIQWTGDNINEIRDFVGESLVEYKTETRQMFGNEVLIKTTDISINTLEGEHQASVDDYIIKGIRGEFCPCKPDIFRETYEIIE